MTNRREGGLNYSTGGVKFPLHLLIQEFLEEVGVDDCNCWESFYCTFLGGRWAKDRVCVLLF